MNSRDRSSLITEIAKRVRASHARSRPLLISIDGLGRTGKSTLAREIVDEVGGIHVAFDRYLTPHQGSYLPFLDYDSIRSDFEAAIDESPSAIILEGICALEVLERIDLTPDLKIYIRRVDQDGTWEEEYRYSEDNDLEDSLRKLDVLEARFSDMPGMADNDRELVRYHIQKHPITNADFVLDLPRPLPPNQSPA